MSMANKYDDGLLSIKAEQLLTEKGFIQHCLHDYHQNIKLDGINESFLKAAEADRFLEPLLQLEGENIQKDGTKKKEIVNYYSPHQIFIIVQLIGNRVGEDGKLVSKDSFSVVSGNRKTTRAITWGWNGITFEIEYFKPLWNGISMFEICKNYNNFLRLLHSLQESRYTSYDMLKERHFNDAPKLQFDYSPLLGNKEILTKYNLSIKKLKGLLGNVGFTATQIDPLEHWYYYIRRHPQWKKDLFKGEALLAQELYIIYDLLSNVIETISGEIHLPLFETLYVKNNIYPLLIPQVEYINGTDVKSMWAAIKGFKDWMRKSDNRNFVEDDTLIRLKIFEKELKEYEEKYKDRSFVSNGVREIEIENNLKIEDLDSKTRQYVEDIIRQAKEQLSKGKKQFLSFWDDDLKEKIKNKEITLKQALKEDYELFVEREIFDAVEQRMRNLKRELWAIFDTVHNKINIKVNETWQIVHDFGNHFWFQHKDEYNKLSPEKHQALFQAEHKKAYDEAQYWSDKRDEFGKVQSTMEFLYCSKCRSKPIRILQDYNEGQFSAKPICEDCFNLIRKTALDGKTIGATKEGEWTCSCGKLLLKFADNNVIAIKTLNEVPIKIELEYGRNTVEAKCPDCGAVNQTNIDWGWLP